MPKDN